MPTGQRYSLEEKKVAVNIVDDLIQNSGFLTKDACEHAEISTSSYQRWKHQVEGTTPEPSPQKAKKRGSNRLIEKAILEETNAFINQLDARIEKAMMDATRKIHKHFKL